MSRSHAYASPDVEYVREVITAGVPVEPSNIAGGVQFEPSQAETVAFCSDVVSVPPTTMRWSRGYAGAYANDRAALVDCGTMSNGVTALVSSW